jgi:hypothetical protein
MGCPAGPRLLSSAPIAAVLLVVVVVGCASQQTAAREQMQALQDRALLDVKKGQTATARKRLLVAVRVGTDARLSSDPLMARTQMTLGALYAQAFRDEKRAVVYMSRALAISPEVKLPAALSAPRARRALALARVRMANLSPAPVRERSQARRATQAPPAPPVAKPAPRPRMAAAPPARPGRNRFRGRPRGGKGALPPLRQGPTGEPVVQFTPDGEPIPPPTGVLPPAAPAGRAPRVAIRSDVPTPPEPPAEPAIPDPEPGLRPKPAPAPLPPAVGRLSPPERRRLAQQQAAAPPPEAPAPALRAVVTSRVPEPPDDPPAVVAAPPPLPAAAPAPPRAPGMVAAASASPAAPPARSTTGAAPSRAGAPPPAAAPPAVADPPPPPAAAAPAVASKVPPPEPAAAPTAVSSAPEPLPAPTFPEGLTDPLYCPVPLEAPPSHEVQLRCAVRPDLRPSRLMLHYRPAGSEKFSAISMQRAGKGFFQGVVPAEATSGKSLQFFVEAGGGAKINAGTAESPNVLLLREGATPVGERSPEEAAENQRAEEEAAAEAERIRREDEDPLAASELKRELALVRRRPAGKLWAALGLGSGYGWQPGSDLEFRPNRRIDPGPLAAGLAHALPEIGYQVTDRLSISVQGRLQYAPVDGSGDPLPGSPRQTATAVLLRGALGFGEGPLHFMATACAGWGKDGGFRLVVPADNKADLPRSDTVQGGPFLAGAGGGLVYHFNPRVSLPLELRALVGFPSVAAVLELGTGLVFAF